MGPTLAIHDALPQFDYDAATVNARWALAHYRLFMSLIHHDPNGLITLIQVLCGAKSWSVVWPTGDEDVKTADELINLKLPMFNDMFATETTTQTRHVKKGNKRRRVVEKVVTPVLDDLGQKRLDPDVVSKLEVETVILVRGDLA